MPILKPFEHPVEKLTGTAIWKRFEEHRKTLDLSSRGSGFDAPLKIETKDGRVIYFHKSIAKKQVDLYEKVYTHFEKLIAGGKLEYNPLSKMYFREDANGNYYALDLHSGETLHELMNSGKLPKDKVNEIIEQLVNYYKSFRDAGVIHGHMHSKNVCLDENGRVKIIDASMMRLLDRNMYWRDLSFDIANFFGLIEFLWSYKTGSEVSYRKIPKGSLSESAENYLNNLLLEWH